MGVTSLPERRRPESPSPPDVLVMMNAVIALSRTLAWPIAIVVSAIIGARAYRNSFEEN